MAFKGLRRRRFIRGRSGQALAEYIILFTLAFAACLVTLWSAEAGVEIFYEGAVDMLCLPVP